MQSLQYKCFFCVCVCFNLEVINGRCRALGGAAAMPLVECVSGFRAQHSSCLILLEVSDQGHRSICASQVVATWIWTQRVFTINTQSCKKQIFWVYVVLFQRNCTSSVEYRVSVVEAPQIKQRYLLHEAAKGPATPSCKVSHCPAAAYHTGPTHRSASAGSHQHHTDDLRETQTRFITCFLLLLCFNMTADDCLSPTDHFIHDYYSEIIQHFLLT